MRIKYILLSVKKLQEFNKYLDYEYQQLNIQKQNAIKDTQINLPKNVNQLYKENTESIGYFKKSEEKLMNFYNEAIIKKEFNIKEIEDKIKEGITNIGKHYKEINDYKNKCINKSEQLVNLFKKYEKVYQKCVTDLMEEIKQLVSLLKVFVDYINDLRNEVEKQKINFENIFKDKEPLAKDQLDNAIFSSYSSFVECYEKIKSLLDQIKLFINKNNSFKKLKAIQEKINKIVISKNIMEKFDFKKPLDSINIFEQLKKNKYIDNLYIPEVCIGQMKFNILFIFDITSSMGKYIELFNKNFYKIIEEIKKNCPLALFYLGFIGYKDINDLELGDEYIDIDFTLLYGEISNRIQNIQAEGGDDIPEDVAGAFEMALKKSWNEGTNIIFLITDSPCHGTKYHNLDQKVESYKDSFPNEFYEGDIEEFKRKSIEVLVEEFVKKNYNLVCLDIHENTQIMFKMFKEKYISKDKEELFSVWKEDLVNCIIKTVSGLYSQEEKEILKKLKKTLI